MPNDDCTSTNALKRDYIDEGEIRWTDAPAWAQASATVNLRLHGEGTARFELKREVGLRLVEQLRFARTPTHGVI